ncbi:copper amine oxidase N-terminal domain-containing protein [Saccharibacillus sacchari]|uniref:Copper amine oxidase N-terminal domain-containing protein n=1 Tax=Saccharibacillus sacchari TaxID=456493 RepID=A0ACC6PBL0_9BACL
MMKNRWVKWVAGLLAGSLLIAPLPHQEAQAATSKPVALSINGASVESSELEVRAGHTYMPVNRLSELLGFLVQYDRDSKILTLLRPDTTIRMKLGNGAAEINGQQVKSTAAFSENGQVFVPLGTLSTALKTKAGWDSATGSATFEDPERYRMDTSGGRTAWVSFYSGGVYSLESGIPKKLAQADVSELEWGTVDLRGLGGNAYVLTVERQYGASMQAVQNRFQFLVKNGVVKQQAHFRYSGMYLPTELGPQKLPAQRAYLTDGQTVQVVGAGGSLAAEYDLQELTKQTGPFIVESVTADYLLVRAFDTLQPTVVNLRTGEASRLDQELLDDKEAGEWSKVSGDIGDLLLNARLRFDRQEGEQLIFTYKRIAPGPLFGQKATVSYKLSE